MWDKVKGFKNKNELCSCKLQQEGLNHIPQAHYKYNYSTMLHPCLWLIFKRKQLYRLFQKIIYIYI